MSAPEPSRLSPIRIFVDADVLIAAAFSPQRYSAALVLLRLCGLTLLDGITSGTARDEAERNCREKLPGVMPQLRTLMAETLTIWRQPLPEYYTAAEGRADAKDVVHLATALEANCRFLVTFNVRDYSPREDSSLGVTDPGGLLRRIRRAVSTAGRHEFADPEDASKEG